MTEICQRMVEDNGKDSPSKCRERRRRRMEMRRLAANSSSVASPSRDENRTESQAECSSPVADSKRVRTTEVAAAAAAKADMFGTLSVSGRSREMEDAITAHASLCRPEINGRRPVHFFGVYDGHGGSHVAALCRERMHLLLEEELMRVTSTRGDEALVVGVKGGGGEEKLEAAWGGVMKRSFERMDEVAMNTCACGSVGYQCGCHPVEIAVGGSTAVVAVVTQEHIVVANCGDSRAVLCRGGKAIPLSVDHKPDRPDELARIEAAGGRVIFLNGARVEGILAMSRAIGDKYLKPVVISEPEITFTERESEDECLILASDGLWDVLSSDLACAVACECLQEGHAPSSSVNGEPNEEAEALYPSRSTLAAVILARLALGRKSFDNISVIVVDLKKSRGIEV
ncbi:hypothetical protein Tsubulata_045487 [Turnera subulata]|uniref:protein-serine/threonine phosphatase n=1 Tax=Turnera subulata TaxID=218843 RepID=A0A9Q0JCU1_9ROSI|nr:hypothetical protein Tsubulata_045487 [Turnera subulata]